MVRLLKDKYFWITIAIFAFIVVLYYAPDIRALSWLSFEENLGLTRRAFARFLFLIPVFISAWKFGFKTGLFCSVAAVLAMTQRVIVSPWRADSILETIIVFCIGVLISWLVSNVEKARRRQKAIADDLAEANLRLQEMDRLKSVFLASMSHELRTPLNSIIGFTGIILKGMVGEINEEQKKQLTMVKNSANHLLSLINDVLDISKIEAGKVEPSPEEFSLNDTVKEVTETLSLAASGKGVELAVEIPEGITLFGDKRRIKQILMNLVSNAVKFTDQGSVKIVTEFSGRSNLKIRVIDTGVGIKKEEMGKLFQPFQQVDLALTKKREGTGLGLYLVNKLATLLGGRVSAESEYGRGSEFTFVVPLRYKEANSEKKGTDNRGQ